MRFVAAISQGFRTCLKPKCDFAATKIASSSMRKCRIRFINRRSIGDNANNADDKMTTETKLGIL